MSPAKILLILIDGVGDLGIVEHGQKTPLQSTDFPLFNAIAKSGLNGLMDPVETGLACGSDTAHMNMFGYPPFTLYRGRGAFESIGAGLPMDTSEIAFKSNFASMDVETRVVKLRRVDRDFQAWGLSLIDEINGMRVPDFPDHYITVQHATEHRCGVKLSGPNLTDAVTGTDPLKDNLVLRKVVAKDQSNCCARETAKIVNRASDGIHEILATSELNVKRRAQLLPEANIVLLRGAGMKLQVDNFEVTHGLNGFMIAPTAIINGLGQTIGLRIVTAPGATGDYHSDYISKIRTAHSHFKQHPGISCPVDFGFLHIKGVDDAGHDKDVAKKIKYLGRVNDMIEEFVRITEASGDEEEYVICITGDHTTPVRIGDHTFEPVPVAITLLSNLKAELNRNKGTGESKKKLLVKDKVDLFNEVSASQGVLGRFPGSQLIPTLKKIKELAEKIN